MLPALRYVHQRPHSNRSSWAQHTRSGTMEANDQIYEFIDPSQPPVPASTSTGAHAIQYPASIGVSGADSLPFGYATGPYNQFAGYTVTPYHPDMPQLPNTPILPDNQTVETERDRQRRRRQEQNRRSQKEFRHRKEQRIKELQAELEKTQKNYQSLSEETSELRSVKDNLEAEIYRLTEENRRLRTSMESSPSSEMAWMPGNDEIASSSSSNPAAKKEGSYRR